MKTIAFFNNKGGVGKTSLVYHVAWMLGLLGHRVLAVDLDPQANLTSMFLPEERLEEIWEQSPRPTLYGAVSPQFRGSATSPRPRSRRCTTGSACSPVIWSLRTFRGSSSPLPGRLPVTATNVPFV